MTPLLLLPLPLLAFLLSSFHPVPAGDVTSEASFELLGDVQLLAVTPDAVYAASRDALYQLSRDLQPLHNQTQRGVANPLFSRTPRGSPWNATLSVKVMIPFAANGTLITCGITSTPRGVCEIWDLRNISKLLRWEDVPTDTLEHESKPVSFLTAATSPYIMMAIQCRSNNPGSKEAVKTIMLLNALETQRGGFFSPGDGTRMFFGYSVGKVDFVDGFQRNKTLYLLSNGACSDKPNCVRIIWFEAHTNKVQALNSVRGRDLSFSDEGGGWRLLASSVVPGGPALLWSGVFTVDGGQTKESNTRLALFDISPDNSILPNNDPDVYAGHYFDGKGAKLLKEMAVLYKQNNISSVLAARKRSFMVFFIGKDDGQLIKLVVNQRLQPLCPELLYQPDEEQKPFPKMHLDPVDQRHIYVAYKNQLKRLPVSKCESFRTPRECLSAGDPFCVWCGSQRKCTFDSDCKDSDWLSIATDSPEKLVTHRVVRDPSGQTTLIVHAHLTAGGKVESNFSCRFSNWTSDRLQARFPRCSHVLPAAALPADGLPLTVEIQLGLTQITERLQLINCTGVLGPPSFNTCQRCVRAGCRWSGDGCSWSSEATGSDDVCGNMSMPGASVPQITSISPRDVSIYGRNHAVLSGQNLGEVVRVRIRTDTSCSSYESPVWNNTGANLTFHIGPSAKTGRVGVCVVLPNGGCHGNADITYELPPLCSGFEPPVSWSSGRRRLTLMGTRLHLVDMLVHGGNKSLHPIRNGAESISFETPASPDSRNISVQLRTANRTLECHEQIIYRPDPKFTSFKDVRIGNDVRVIVQKRANALNLRKEDLTVWAVAGEREFPCVMEETESRDITDSFICQIRNHSGGTSVRQLKIRFGDQVVTLTQSDAQLWTLLVLLLIPVILIAVLIVFRTKQKKLTRRMNKIMEDLELDIRKDIRQGFVDLQTEKAELMENVGAIPFLDYKHFAARIFFPESEALMSLCIKDIGQDGVTVQLDECHQGLSKLIQDRLFLTSMVQALEAQKTFGIKDKCALASLLTVALHSRLIYLTEVMELLLRDLMQHNVAVQPKLLLRRTESTVEKLLTNWMSICLYGFLRESVGQHLFLLVSALSQQISKGPVDGVTGKALYTLSEDWLLWQVPDFSSLKLRVQFAVGSDGGVSEPLDVHALSCDTVEQLKEKILSTFKAKFGFPYSRSLLDLCMELERAGSSPLLLQEVDSGCQVVGEVTMLNTLQHYKVSDGATVKVVSRKAQPPLGPQRSVKDDENFSGKYFHLIHPDTDEDPNKSPEKKKLKVKELHLTKLLSTKVAVHTYVENLFRSIWAVSQGRAPPAVKYYFDFLDAQADSLKITDPDVLHIWKTNSLPLRFWINILKNPQFVFDLEKSPHLDGCLSVIAQAFMDCFSLSDIQLGKHAPTNKLLYARDIPAFKQEVKSYYKLIRDLPPSQDAEFRDFLREESKKHESEFNEAAALREIYKYIRVYSKQIVEKLDQNGAPAELKEQLRHVEESFQERRSCSWD